MDLTASCNPSATSLLGDAARPWASLQPPQKLLCISWGTEARCDAAIAEVIKCISLSRFPKAALTQRQLFPHSIYLFIYFNEYADQPKKTPANPSEGRKQTDKHTSCAPCCGRRAGQHGHRSLWVGAVAWESLGVLLGMSHHNHINQGEKLVAERLQSQVFPAGFFLY